MMKTLIIYFTIIGFIFVGYSCNSNSEGNSDNSGIGGSTARFTIKGNYLYAVNNQTLKVFDISSPQSVLYKKDKFIGFGIETIFPFEDKLFIGSQNGMYVYDVSNPELPEQLCQFSHVFSCDPVISDGKFAYVTLHSENSRCGRTTNELQIINIEDITKPVFIKSYPMSKPLGLGIDNKKLFVCDNGIKIFNITNEGTLIQTEYLSVDALDVIPYKNLLITVGLNSLTQYDYSTDKLVLLSTVK